MTIYRPARILVALAAVAVALTLLAACGAESEPTPESIATPAGTAPTPTTAPAPPTVAPPAATGETIVEIADGSLARYRVNETLARTGVQDAVGETADVSGAIHFDANGVVFSDQSSISVDLRTLASDSGRRDNYVRTNTFETNKYPTADFTPMETEGLPWPLPSSGEVTFTMKGDMTLHGVTSPLSWDVTAQFGDGRATGLATTSFTFDTFDLDIPRLAFILSVEDNIRVELDFTASVSAGGH